MEQCCFILSFFFYKKLQIVKILLEPIKQLQLVESTFIKVRQ